jgi:hypothetical protein
LALSSFSRNLIQANTIPSIMVCIPSH